MVPHTSLADSLETGGESTLMKTENSIPYLPSIAELMAIHFDPHWGTEYWLARRHDLPFDPLKDIQESQDIAMFGPFPEEELRQGSCLRFLPRRFHQNLVDLILSETGGATGSPKRVLFSPEEFAAGFIDPFIAVAKQVGWPEGVPWLFLGPTGPHIIGHVVAPICRKLSSPPPFCIDFDPRWSARLPPGSVARARYLEHLADQAMDVLHREEIGVLFSTPPLLERIAQRLEDKERERIQGVHYGGMALSFDQYLLFKESLFPKAVHLSGYGNSLAGVAFETSSDEGGMLSYYPSASRHQIRLIPLEGESIAERLSCQVSSGATGQVVISRLDATYFIPNLIERDIAELVGPSPSSRSLGWGPAGIRQPRPAPESKVFRVGFY